MNERKIPWKAEWKAAGLDPGPLTEQEQVLVPRLEEENRRFLNQHPFSSTIPRPRSPRLIRWTAPLAAVAAILVLAIPFGAPLTSQGSSSERIKGPGDPVLTVYRQGSSGPEKLSSGAKVRAGDILQAAYQVTRPVEGAIVSVDGRGVVTIHLASGQKSVRLVSGAEQYLSSGYELDAAPQFEVFFLVTSDRPFFIEPLQKILASTAWNAIDAKAFGPDLHFTVLAFFKEPTR